VRELREWIESEIHLDLTNAPFDPQDGTLLPAAGSCAACPKRTGNNPLLFPEVRQKSICTDRACYRMKIDAFVQIRMKPLEAAGEKPLRVVDRLELDRYVETRNAEAKAALETSQW